MRPFGDDATSVGGGSACFAANAVAATRCDARSNPARGDWISDDGASGFDLVARFGRRRTSTVNEGTARLNVVLDTAQLGRFVSQKTLRGMAQQSNRRLSGTNAPASGDERSASSEVGTPQASGNVERHRLEASPCNEQGLG